MYDVGLGVEQDYDEALKWFRKAAEQNNAYAQTYIGFMYEEGHGVEKDLIEAIRWYKIAADQGNEYAIEQLKIIANE